VRVAQTTRSCILSEVQIRGIGAGRVGHGRRVGAAPHPLPVGEPPGRQQRQPRLDIDPAYLMGGRRSFLPPVTYPCLNEAQSCAQRRSHRWQTADRNTLLVCDGGIGAQGE
jgi:hypothetical protein